MNKNDKETIVVKEKDKTQNILSFFNEEIQDKIIKEDKLVHDNDEYTFHQKNIKENIITENFDTLKIRVEEEQMKK